jgi:hypothetical protein
MRLLASLQNENRWHELLAEIEATEDTHEQWGDLHVRRCITGTIRQLGPIWNAFIPFWQKMASSGIAAVSPRHVPGELDGHRYFVANLLQVVIDLYTSPAAINVEGPTIRLALVELYTDPIGDYAEHLRERNRRVEDLHRRFDQGQITVNDLRSFSGLQPWPAPQGTRLIPAGELAQVRELHLEQPMSQLTRNHIH